ncbi:hypothetical protein, partial [Vibrio parahaemolyticus]|uniref:hypothetical protein n=1 Tax=Vibrio parahaemolyticus TaxID=670 RepID=UPI001BAEBCB5
TFSQNGAGYVTHKANYPTKNTHQKKFDANAMRSHSLAKNPKVLFSRYNKICKPSKGRLTHISIPNHVKLSHF